MMRAVMALPIVLLVGCGESPPVQTLVSPSPVAATTPSPSVTINGTVTDTVTGATVGAFSQAVQSLPTRISVSHAGYVTREVWITSPAPRVDLFPESGFDLAFYRQLLRNDRERGVDPLWPLRVLPSTPAFYIETEGPKGFPRQLATRLEALARRLVPAMTGGRLQVTRWETGPTPRERQSGWIVIERREEEDACGRAYVGELAGRIWMSDRSGCRVDSTFAHELGHALGYWHVDRTGTIMFPRSQRPDESTPDDPNEFERLHMALAYARPRGNMDIDVDPQEGGVSGSQIVVD